MNALGTLIEIIITAFLVVLIALIGMGKLDKSVAENITCADCEIAKMDERNQNTQEENMKKLEGELTEIEKSEGYQEAVAAGQDEGLAELEAEIEALRNQD